MPTEYIYKLIETMLPKAQIDPDDKKFRMVELWPIDKTPRQGWFKILSNFV